MAANVGWLNYEQQRSTGPSEKRILLTGIRLLARLDQRRHSFNGAGLWFTILVAHQPYFVTEGDNLGALFRKPHGQRLNLLALLQVVYITG